MAVAGALVAQSPAQCVEIARDYPCRHLRAAYSTIDAISYLLDRRDIAIHSLVDQGSRYSAQLIRILALYMRCISL
jgi:hypothetical protein